MRYNVVCAAAEDIRSEIKESVEGSLRTAKDIVTMKAMSESIQEHGVLSGSVFGATRMTSEFTKGALDVSTGLALGTGRAATAAG